MHVTRTMTMAVSALALLVVGARAAPPSHPQAESQALELAEKAIALRSVRGPGNQKAQVAAL